MGSFKSIFSSKTIWAALATLGTIVLPVAQTCATESRAPTPAEISTMGTVLLTTALTIYGRYAATKLLSTPAGLPGRDTPPTA